MSLDQILAQIADESARTSLISNLPAESFGDLRGLERTLAEHLQTLGTDAESVAQMRTIGTVIDAIRAETTSRQQVEAEASTLRSQYAVPAEEPVEEDAPAPTAEAAAPVVEEVAEVVPVAAAAPAPAAPVAAVPTPGSVTPPADSLPVVESLPVRELSFTASADIPGVSAGTTLTLSEVADALVARQGNFRGSAPRGYEQVPVARLPHQFPIAEAELGPDAHANQAVIASLMRGRAEGDTALLAAGGICAPLTPEYNFLNVSTTARPVRDALMPFRAVRGGISFNDPIPFTDYNGAVDQWTTTDDTNALTDSSVRKPCLRVDCGETTDVRIYAVTNCLTFGNLNARAYPELVADALAKSMSAHARLAERLLLTQMATNSTNVTEDKVLGATRDVLFVLHKLVAAFRYRHRTDPNLRMRVLAPAWLRDMLAADLARQMPGDATLGAGYAEVEGYLESANISVSWILDGETNGALPAPPIFQGFTPLVAGEAAGFPSNTRLYVFHEGAHIFLDSGSLDLGIVRDSTLNAMNDYQVFSETFEGLATPGFDPITLDIPLCPTGEASQLADPGECGAGAS